MFVCIYGILLSCCVCFLFFMLMIYFVEVRWYIVVYLWKSIVEVLSFVYYLDFDFNICGRE